MSDSFVNYKESIKGYAGRKVVVICQAIVEVRIRFPEVDIAIL